MHRDRQNEREGERQNDREVTERQRDLRIVTE